MVVLISPLDFFQVQIILFLQGWVKVGGLLDQMEMKPTQPQSILKLKRVKFPWDVAQFGVKGFFL